MDAADDASVDVTAEVRELSEQMGLLFAGHRMPIVTLALGDQIGMAAPNEEMLHGILGTIASIAGQVFAAKQLVALTPEEGTTIQ